MSTRALVSSLEILESRIAPASLLVTNSGAAADPLKTKVISAGDQKTYLTSVNVAGTTAGASLAILVSAGDLLAFDSGTGAGDGLYNKNSDPTLINVTAGRALVFFTDLNNDAHITPNEITGVRVSNGFAGTINAPVHGSVVTDLNDSRGVSTVGGRVAIKSLIVTNGNVDGSVLATGAIGALAITGGDPAYASVETVLTGSAAQGFTGYSLNGGEANGLVTVSAKLPKFLNVSGDLTLFKKGASTDISNLTLGSFGGRIEAGAGGSISNVSIGTVLSDLTMTAGVAPTDLNTDGGSIAGVTVGAAKSGLVLNYTFTAGQGGELAGKAGGAGGDVTGIKLFANGGSAAGVITLTAGPAGGGIAPGTSKSFGGGGGTIYDVVIKPTAAISINLTAGDGGESVSTRGGDGGAIGFAAKTNALIDLAGGPIFVKAGDGGKPGGSGAAGNGGDIVNLKSTTTATLTLTAGKGEDAPSGAGGAGGSIGDVSAYTAIVSLGGPVIAKAGAGGTSFGAKDGGSGGAIANLSVTSSGISDLKAGKGGDSTSGAGGVGGAIGSTKLPGAVTFSGGAVTVLTGGGGQSLSNTPGGDGGGIFHFNASGATLIGLTTGDGGDSTFGHGGNGGAIGSAAIYGAVSADGVSVTLETGHGGSSGGALQGGAGGGILNLESTVTSLVKLTTGIGGTAAAIGGLGGSIGLAAGNSLVALTGGVVTIESGTGGDSLGSLPGGVGGSVANLKSLNNSGFTLTSGDGGASATGTGGAGGAVGSAIAVYGISSSGGAPTVQSGAGGAGARGACGGAINQLTLSNVPTGSAVVVNAGLTSAGTIGQAYGATVDGVNITGQDLESVTVAAGDGGTLPIGTIPAFGVGGAWGGSVRNVTMNVSSLASLSITAGQGTDATGPATSVGTLNGGYGGEIRGVTLSQPGSQIFTAVTMLNGSGGAGLAGGAGGRGGDLAALTLDHVTAFDLLAGTTGPSGPTGGGVAGASVSNVTLTAVAPAGVFNVKAGAGTTSNSTAAGGTGGDIIGVKISNAKAVTYVAGAGGDGPTGGNGGKLMTLAVTQVDTDGSLDLTAGDAGTGFTTPGAAGGVTGLTVTGGDADSVTIAAGLPSAAPSNDAVSTGAAGKAGGGISGITLGTLAPGGSFSLNTLSITATDGGFGNPNGNPGAGGDGGSIMGVNLLATSGATVVTLTAGIGGDAGSEVAASGGKGGSIGSVSAGIDLHYTGDVTIMAGIGGTGRTGGAGGAIDTVHFSQVATDANLAMTAGDSGPFLTVGTDGGSILHTMILSGDDVGSLTLKAGTAGAASANSVATAGSGGSVTTLSIICSTLGTLSVTAGNGATGGTTYSDFSGKITGGGAGGDGGALKGITLSLQSTDDGAVTDVTLNSGTGGDGGGGKTAGNGGAISGLALDSVGLANITSGNGGNSGGNGNAGNGGAMIFGALDHISSIGDVMLTAGDGGAGAEADGKTGGGGNGGSITGPGTAGTAYQFTASAGSLKLTGGDGGAGSASDIAADAAGGTGGNVTGLRISSSATDAIALTITGGRGADGIGSATGRQGGSITGLEIDADAFGFDTISITAGDGGAAGDVETRFGQGGDAKSIAITSVNPIDLTIATIVAGGDGGDADGIGTGLLAGVTINGDPL